MRIAAALAVSAAVAAVAVALTTTADVRDPGSLVDVGPPRSVTAQHLDDGTPVFVVHLDDGDVVVVESLAPYWSTLGIDVHVGWCDAVAMFQEPFAFSELDAAGRPVRGPASTGLVPRAVHRDGAEVRAGGVLPAATRDTAPHPGLWSGMPPDVCEQLLPPEVDHELPQEPVVAHDPPDHLPVASAEELWAQPLGTVAVVTAAVEVGDEGARMCSGEPAFGTLLCDGSAPPAAPVPFAWLHPLLEGRRPAEAAGRTDGIHGTFVVRRSVEGLEITEVFAPILEYHVDPARP